MDDALRMDHYRDAADFNVEEPARLDHFQAFVKERGRIDGDLAAHDPGRMFQGPFDGDARELRFWRGPKRTAGSGEPKPPNGTGGFAIEALKNGGVLAIHRQNADALLAGFAHDQRAGHHQDFFGSDSDVFAGADRSQRRLQAGSADDRNHDNVGAGESGQLHQAFRPRKNLGAGAQSVAKFLSFGGIDNGNGFRAVLAGLFDEHLEVVPGAEGKQTNPVRQILSDFYSAGAD